MMHFESSSLLLVFRALALVSVSKAAIYTDPAAIALKDYDFVVVGAGIGGAVVGGRLSENGAHRVLVVEAGGSISKVVLL